MAENKSGYFLSLELENVKSFGARQKIDLSDGNGRPAPWTVILGENGVGKTTVLRAIAVLADMHILRNYDWNYKRGSRNYDEELMGLPSAIECLAYWGGNIKQKVDPDRIERSFAFFAVRNARINEPIFARPNHIEGITFFAYGANRRLAKTQISSRGFDNSNEESTLFNENAVLRSAEEWFLRVDYLAEKEPRYKKYRNIAIELLIRLLPDVSDVRYKQAESINFNPGVQFATPYGWVSINDLSLGYQSLIGWMVDLASRMFERYPDSENPLAEPAVVLVDEIDLHLHPKYQRMLMSFLTERFPNVQFIVTAHSPLVVQGAPDANIVVIKQENGEARVHQDIEVIKNWRVDQILTSELFDLPTARPVETENLMSQRNALLAKPRLSKKDKEELKSLDSKIGPLPFGDSKEEVKVTNLIKEMAAKLKQEGKV